MESAFDTNTQVFHDAFKMFEVQQAVIFRMLQDVFNGRVRVKGHAVVDENGVPRAVVDVEGYIREHLEELSKLEEQKAEQKEEAAPESVLASPDDESPIIFGGDGP